MPNDPRLWKQEGIEAALDEVIDEKGASIEWGWVCLGATVRRRRLLDPQSDMPKVPSKSYLELNGIVTVTLDEVRDFLLEDARATLDLGTRFELRQVSNNFGRTHGMAWYSNAAMQREEPWGRVPKVPEQRIGYLLVGQFTAE